MTMPKDTATTAVEANDHSHSIKPNVITEDALTPSHGISIYRDPVLITHHFALYLLEEASHAVRVALSYTRTVAFMAAVVLLYAAAYLVPGPVQPLAMHIQSEITWAGYWILLGIASSVGLGTGLHTFVLFLGPHIAEVTLAAFECGHVDFAVRGPDSFVCGKVIPAATLSLWSIIRKIYWQSFCWGAGTAIGELPPYFVARAAALAGQTNEEMDEISELLEKPAAERTLKDKVYLFVYSMMQRLGFLGIFLCASIPNPLFDLAGISCGHFLIPFSTFFGATFLGKAVVKAAIQSVFVVVMFSKDSLAAVLDVLARIAPPVHDIVAKAVAAQTRKLQAGGDAATDGAASQNGGLIPFLWNGFITVMLLYFLLSIVDSLGSARYEKLRRRDQAKAKKET
ncbi:vacuole membrane protein 1 [Syncephalis pseudoplumigaleata]|uniref:Vacuole membrane protein 1 n=1 Tax=Syncephalis pseudoplumigaleata TaxID=1712513 RepID=A0A4P9Z1L5_9FUNG|nr:vacuole membrane protein 1 [Syncephalis pseudoplumigaleata]|eukprot:RKP25842.1 vacuole membrane protein 1 [Syncephalis pseudoplumigaleata]